MLISNFIQNRMIHGAKTFLTHLFKAIQVIVQLVLGVAKVIYQDIIYVTAYLIWAVLWILVYIYQGIQFIGSQLIRRYNTVIFVANSILMYFASLLSALQTGANSI